MSTQYPNIEAVNPTTCYSNKMMTCNRIIANIFRKHLKAFDISDSQLSILFFVVKSKKVRQKNIAEFLSTEKSTVHRNLKRLIDHHYLSINKMDIVATAKGKDLLEKIIPSWENAMREVKELLSTDGENAINQLHTILKNKSC